MDRILRAIAARRREIPPDRAVLVAISGIDGAGKGYCAERIARSLGQHNLKVALIGADGWLNLPDKRFAVENPAEHFYENGFRFDEMFETLVLPLREKRSIDLLMSYTDETATSYREHRYQFRDIDVILLEGIFLLKRALRPHFDLTCWVECPFGTALARAVKRCQEGLPPHETVGAFTAIYFPAQCLHFECDAPRLNADLTLLNAGEPVGSVAACPDHRSDYASQTGGAFLK